MDYAFLVILQAFLLKLVTFDSAKAQITCTVPGFYPLQDVTCQYYYMCYSDGAGYSAQISKCPGSTVFDPTRSGCVLPSQYSCIETTTTVDPYSCTSAGRFPIMDPTCKSYYLCYWSTNVLTRRMFRCPNLTIFNPTRQLCVLSTTYACVATTTSTSTTLRTTISTTPSTTTSSTTPSTTTSSTTPSTTTSSTTPSTTTSSTTPSTTTSSTTTSTTTKSIVNDPDAECIP